TFEAGTGATEYDKSGNSNTGTWGGTGTHYAGGKVGSYAGQFNGTDDYIRVESASSLGATNVTVSAWINPTACNSASTIEDRDGSYTFQLHSDCKIRSYLWGASPAVYRSSTNTVSTSIWTHVAYVYDQGAGTQKFYLNGVLDNSYSGISGLSAGGHLGLGAIYTGTTNRLTGLLDDIRIYNRALSSAEILAIYNATK
ncbi:MAG: LamG domain-containing protein, partial [Candidatus Pacebacteria bacterium]|nr:LamG domain-containing protein [Candidatus Paceibacterota bacterium]